LWVGGADDTLATENSFALRVGGAPRCRPAVRGRGLGVVASNAALKPLLSDDDVSHPRFAGSVRAAGVG
jgi:hypothetical protein